MNIITFLLYYKDKKASQNGKWRTRESTLHLLALMGGWTGALFTQRVFRHKISKQPFKTIFYITIIGNVGLMIWSFVSLDTLLK